MQVSALSVAASRDSENEDWVSVHSDLIVVLDGATVRTGTGCAHGVAWYVRTLGSAISSLCADPRLSLPGALRTAIEVTARRHAECDLAHPGTPAAAVAIVRRNADKVEYLCLGDVAIVLDSASGTNIICDDRVTTTAKQQRAEADRYPIGSTEKQEALVLMKHEELAARNRPGGYWVAAADPSSSENALLGAVPDADLRRLAVLTDGAARMVTPFGLTTWPELLEMIDVSGLEEVVRRTRVVEQSDPKGLRWPRNKPSDDATIAFARLSG